MRLVEFDLQVLFSYDTCRYVKKFFNSYVLSLIISVISEWPGAQLPVTCSLIVRASPTVMNRKVLVFKSNIESIYSWLNFLSLPFEKLYREECWMFAPRTRETKFLQYYLQHPIRPGLTVLSLERGDLPALYNLARKNCSKHRIVRKFIFESIQQKKL